MFLTMNESDFSFGYFLNFHCRWIRKPEKVHRIRLNCIIALGCGPHTVSHCRKSCEKNKPTETGIFFNKHYAKNKQTVSQNKTSFTDLILYWFSLNYNKNITGRLWAWLYVKLPLWHSAYHMNTCLERRSAPQHQSWSEMITSCQAFHCYCPLNYYCLLVVCIIQYLIQYVWKQNKELCAIFTTIIPSRVLSVFAAQGAFCTGSEHHHLTQ